MEYLINYNEGSNIVQVKFTGRTSFKIAEQSSKEAIKLAHEHNCRRFILDHADTDSLIHIHSSEEELQQFGFQNSDRIAIVSRSGQTKTLSQNSRWSQSEYFRNVEEANSWLLLEE